MRFSFTNLCAALLLSALLCSTRADALQAGAAKIDITAPVGTPLNGYGYRLGRGATEIHDPLWARCLYLEQDDTRIFLVTTDLCIINSELRNRVVELAPGVVPAENIILTATHTHSGHGGMIKALAGRIVSGRFMPEVLEATAMKIAQAMRMAYAARRRAAIGYGTGAQDVLSKNRRHEDGPIDTQIGVIRVDDSDGNSIAILANFAAHPTTVGKDYAFAFSADYPGYFYTKLEELATPGCIAMFLNGAEGNQKCANPERVDGWARTRSIGTLLAVRTKGIANSITCSELSLHVGHSTPILPRTIATSVMPSKTFLQTLEIGDLLITFFPGEPCVEIGLEMRRRAQALGYAQQFTVGLANDHLMYFVPTEFYGHDHYEAGMNFYGPYMAQWFYDEFESLIQRQAAKGNRTPPQAAIQESIAGGTRIMLSGSPYDIGYQRGNAFSESIHRLYEERVVSPVRERRVLPDSGFWNALPSFIDPVPLALPLAAVGARRLLNGLSIASVEEIQGMADATSLPFDALWLLQAAPSYVSAQQSETLFPAPMCTIFAVVGKRAGAEELLVGRVLDWPLHERPVVAEVHPAQGHSYVSVGFEWNAGAFTGMNDAGLVVAVERSEGLGLPGFDAPPIEFVLKEILLNDETLDQAIQRVQSFEGLVGYRVLLAHHNPPEAAIISLATQQTTRRATSGLLLGSLIEDESTNADDRSRYGRVEDLLADERIISVPEIETVLADHRPTRIGNANIFNGQTHHAVVFDPKRLRMRVAFPAEDGTLGPFETITLGERR